MLPAKYLRNNTMLKVKNITDHLSNQHCQLQLAQHEKCCKINSALTSSNLIWKIRWTPRKTNVNYKMILLTKYGIKGTTKLEQIEETFKIKQRILSLSYANSIYTKWVNQMPQPDF